MARKRKFPFSYVIVFFAALTVFLLWPRPKGPRGAAPLARTIAYHSPTLQSARVLRIVDGDTLQVSVSEPGSQRSVTLMLNIYGIDAPETQARSGQSRVQGHAARDYLESLITPGTEIEVDLKGRNEQGQSCAVFLAAGGRDAGCALLEAGLARVKIAENDPLAAHYGQAQQIAKSSHSGIWK